MSSGFIGSLLLTLMFALCAPFALAQMPNPYGAPIGVEDAKKAAAALFKRPTKVFQDVVAGGGSGLRILRLEGAVPVEGGVPLIMEGKIVGAIGLSGAASDQDGQCARAGAEALK